MGLARRTDLANQIAAGGSGVDPGVLGALAECVNRRISPPVPGYGAIGTGDLTALAVTALCLRGEREWLRAPARPPRFALEPADALAFISSNALSAARGAAAAPARGRSLRGSG